MNIKEIITTAQKIIKTLDAEILACEVFNISKTQLITKSEEKISVELQKKFLDCVQQRKNGQSISEILKRKNFYGYDFIVNNDVLTPRPETEILVENAFEYIQENDIQEIIDIGTGSGCIIITLALLLEKINNNTYKKFLAVDISEKALQIAKENAEKFDQQKNIIFKKSDLLSQIKNTEIENACIITNLPYIPESDILAKEVINGDPKLALFSGKKGSDLYTQFFNQLPDTFSAVFFEFDPPQQKYFQKLLSEKFTKRKIYFFPDYSGDIRFGKVI